MRMSLPDLTTLATDDRATHQLRWTSKPASGGSDYASGGFFGAFRAIFPTAADGGYGASFVEPVVKSFIV